MICMLTVNNNVWAENKYKLCKVFLGVNAGLYVTYMLPWSSMLQNPYAVKYLAHISSNFIGYALARSENYFNNVNILLKIVVKLVCDHRTKTVQQSHNTTAALESSEVTENIYKNRLSIANIEMNRIKPIINTMHGKSKTPPHEIDLFTDSTVATNCAVDTILKP